MSAAGARVASRQRHAIVVFVHTLRTREGLTRFGIQRRGSCVFRCAVARNGITGAVSADLLMQPRVVQQGGGGRPAGRVPPAARCYEVRRIRRVADFGRHGHCVAVGGHLVHGCHRVDDAVVRRRASEQLVRQASNAPDIRAAPVRLAAHDLGRRVERRADEGETPPTNAAPCSRRSR
jgi:hypothetical protein